MVSIREAESARMTSDKIDITVVVVSFFSFVRAAPCRRGPVNVATGRGRLPPHGGRMKNLVGISSTIVWSTPTGIVGALVDCVDRRANLHDML